MIRIVLDTNIFISSLLQPQGLPAEMLRLALVGERVRLCVSGRNLFRIRRSYSPPAIQAE
jgi:predicted nucleic acid-binding protein